MLLETTILEQISTKNLVKVTLSETQLESNFQAILKALKSHDFSIANLISKVNSLESTAKNHESLLGQREKQGKKAEQSSISEQAFKKLLKDTSVNDQQLKKLASDVSVLKEKVSTIDDTTKEMESNIHKNQENVQRRLDKLENLEGFIKKTEDRLDKIEGNMQKYDKYDERIKQLERDLEQQLDKMSKLDQALLKIDKLAREDKQKEGKQGNNQKMSDQNLQKALIQLESRLINMMNEQKNNTGKEFQRIYGMINDINKSQIVKITETLNEHAKNSKKMSEDIWKLNDQLYKHQSQQPQASSGEPFNVKRVTQLERKVQQLSRMLSNLGHDSSNIAKNYSTAFKTPQKIDEIEWSPAPKRQKTHQKQESKDLNQIKQESLLQEKTNFKKEIIQKLKQQKGDFNKAIKKIENINLKKEEDKQKIEDMQEKLLRLEHIINGKIDEQGMKKWMRYIQNKINYLYRIINVESPEEDACIARKNWICLSCDKKLDAYKGKVGNHLASAQMKGKSIEQDVVGGGMLFRSKSKYEMPTIKK